MKKLLIIFLVLSSFTGLGQPGSDGSYQVIVYSDITAISAATLTITCTYTDEGNTSRVVTLNFSTLAGAFTSTIANAGGAVPYEGVPLHIRCKAYTTITVATTGTFTTVVYNIESQLIKLN